MRYMYKALRTIPNTLLSFSSLLLLLYSVENCRHFLLLYSRIMNRCDPFFKIIISAFKPTGSGFVSRPCKAAAAQSQANSVFHRFLSLSLGKIS